MVALVISRDSPIQARNGSDAHVNVRQAHGKRLTSEMLLLLEHSSCLDVVLHT